MLETVAYCLIMLFYSATGALFISWAISSFKRKRYYAFGFDVMLAVHQIACIVEAVFKYD